MIDVFEEYKILCFVEIFCNLNVFDYFLVLVLFFIMVCGMIENFFVVNLEL